MMPIRGYSPDFAYQLYVRSHFRLILGPNQCVIMADTYSKKIRVNTWTSAAIVCLLKDQVKTNRPKSTKHQVVLSGQSPDYARWDELLYSACYFSCLVFLWHLLCSRFLPYVGIVTILMNDYPQLKVSFIPIFT